MEEYIRGNVPKRRAIFLSWGSNGHVLGACSPKKHLESARHAFFRGFARPSKWDFRIADRFAREGKALAFKQDAARESSL